MTSSLDLSINASMLSMLLRILRINEAVVQYVVDDVGQTVNGRAAHIFDALSTMQSLQAHDAITEPNPRETPYAPFHKIAYSATTYRNPRETPPSGVAPAAQQAVGQTNRKRSRGFALVLLNMQIGCDAHACSLRSLTPRMRVYASPGRHCFWFLTCVIGTCLTCWSRRPLVRPQSE